MEDLYHHGQPYSIPVHFAFYPVTGALGEAMGSLWWVGMGTVAGWTTHSIGRSWRTVGRITYQGGHLYHTYTSQTTAGYIVPGTHKDTPIQATVGVCNVPLSLPPPQPGTFAHHQVVVAVLFHFYGMSFPDEQGIHEPPVPADATSMSMWVALYLYLLTAFWKFPCALPSKPSNAIPHTDAWDIEQ